MKIKTLCSAKIKLRESKFIKDYDMERTEMSSLLNLVAIISASIIGFTLLCVVLYVVYNILAERREVKIFASDSGEK
jgi:hypothetical protein